MQQIPQAELLLAKARELLQNLRVICMNQPAWEAYQKKYGKSVWTAMRETETAIYHLEELTSGMRHEINTGPSRVEEIFARNPENPVIDSRPPTP